MVSASRRSVWSVATVFLVVSSMMPPCSQGAWLLTSTTRSTAISRPQSKWNDPSHCDKGKNFMEVSSSRASTTKLPMATSSSSSSSSSEGGAKTIWALPNDFPLFLNQCAIQSFMFLLRSLRDPQTVLWLEEFTQPVFRSKRAIIQDAIDKNTNNEKAPSSSPPSSPPAAATTGAAETNPDGGDAAAAASSDMPPTPQVPMTSDTTPNSGINAKTLLYHGLGLLNTTLFPTWDVYFRLLLEQPSTTFLIESSRPHIPSYELQINPASLCSRILSVREQIAQEFANDLQVISTMGGQTLETYWNAVKDQEKGGDAYNNPNMMKGLRPNLAFLDFTSGYDDDDENDYAPSPLRKGNFDLLMLLTTQEAIHRVLNSEARSSQAQHQGDDFLYNFYSERLVTHFTGNQPYGRADDFLEELLMTPPRLLQLSDTVTSLVDPVRIAELILNEREQVALEWKQVARDSPQMHMEIKRLQLNRLMMGRTGNEEATSYQ